MPTVATNTENLGTELLEELIEDPVHSNENIRTYSSSNDQTWDSGNHSNGTSVKTINVGQEIVQYITITEPGSNASLEFNEKQTEQTVLSVNVDSRNVPLVISEIVPSYVTTSATSVPSGNLEYLHAGYTADGKKKYKCCLCKAVVLNKTAHKAKHRTDCPYVCTREGCGRSFKRNSTLRNHIVQVHPTHLYECRNCKQTFKTIYTLRKHENLICNKSKEHTCYICGKDFRLLSILRKHEALHRKSDQYRCPKCAKKLASLEELQSHMLLHGDGLFVCPEIDCELMFSSVDDYSEHKKSHIGQQYNCTVCDENFNTVEEVESHRSTHNRSEWPYVCSVCDKRFLNIVICHIHEKLKHKIAHPELCDVDNDTTCPVCLKELSDRPAWHSHMFVHSIQILECPYCAKGFSREIALIDHVKRVHESEAIFSCETCNKTFKRETHLKEHISTHTKPYKCCDCEECFSLEVGLKRHQMKQTKPLFCENCKDGFSSVCELKRHKLKNFNCNRKIRDLPAKVAKFTLVRQYNCELCVAMFDDEALLNTHELKIHGEELVACNECAQAMIPRLLPQHLFTVHGVGEEHSCVECHRVFYSSSDLQNHIISIHRRQCYICFKTFTHFSRLHQHMKEVHVHRTFQCMICRKKFKREKVLKDHMKTHSKPFHCKHCGLRFSLERSLKSHESIHDVDCTDNILLTADYHPEKKILRKVIEEDKYDCEYCMSYFRNEESLIQHEIKMHPKEGGFFCNYCHQQFLTERIMKEHLHEVHEVGEIFTCEICRRIFFSSLARERHISFVHNKKCPTCGKEFLKIGRLNAHIKEVHIDAMFECSVCKKRFKREKHLKEHSNTHTKPFECFKCNARYSSKKTLDNHSKGICFNEGQKSFPCRHCESVFYHPEDIIEHNESDHSDKPKLWYLHVKTENVKKEKEQQKIYDCELCESKFSMESSLINHEMKWHHESKLDCDHCTVKFITPRTLRKHQFDVHSNGEEIQCDLCTRMFYTNSELEEHKSRVHVKQRFACKVPYCGKKFDRQFRLNSHLKDVHGNRKYECITCGNKFKLKKHLSDHMNTHTKPFTCSLCGERFSLAKTLKKHEETHQPGNNVVTCNVTTCVNCDLTFASRSDLQLHVEQVHYTKLDSFIESPTVQQYSEVQSDQVKSELSDQVIYHVELDESNLGLPKSDVDDGKAKGSNYKSLLKSFITK